MILEIYSSILFCFIVCTYLKITIVLFKKFNLILRAEFIFVSNNRSTAEKFKNSNVKVEC